MSITLTGKYEVSPGVPDRGRVFLEAVTVDPATGEVSPISRVVDAAGHTVYNRLDSIVVDLGPAGEFSIELLPTDQEGLSPAGFGWRLTPRLASGTGDPIVFPLVGAGEVVSVDLSEIVAGSPVARWPWFDVTKKASDVLMAPLEKFPDATNVQEAVEAIAGYTVSGDVGAHVADPDPHPQYATHVEVSEAVSSHEDSELPHPSYDNGPSLVLAYMNAKV